MEPIVIATGNPHKVEEIRAIFAEAGARGGGELVGLREAAPGGLAEPEETGRTFEENATIKAVTYARALGRACLADDSGLEVDALGGAPGVISSHYATDGVETGASRAERDAANNARLLREMEGAPEDRRSARFVCVMVLAGPDGRVLARSRGEFRGRIGRAPDVPRGEHGFGYDPLFLLPAPEIRTSAELSPEEKNALSHRGKAARSMAEEIRRLT